MTGTRGGVGRIVGVAIALAVVLTLIWADAARAGTYEVAQCGWGIGADLAGIDTSGPGFLVGAEPCSPAGGGSAGLRLEALSDGGGYTGSAAARWAAPSGTSIMVARATWSGDLQPAFGQALAASGGGHWWPLANAQSLTPPSTAGGPTGVGATAVRVELSCGNSCRRGAPSSVLLRDLTFTILDPTPPSVRLDGGALGSGWLRGTTQLTLGAEDVGSGVASMGATVDGASLLSASQTCATATIEGELRATRMRPCPPTASQTFDLDTTRIGDGSHTLRACALDFGGGSGCAPDVPLKVDNSPPSIAFVAAPEGQVAARIGDPYSGPASGSIEMQRTGETEWADLDTRFDAGAGGTARLSAALPTIGDGSYLFRVTASDAVGNVASAQRSVAGSAAQVRQKIAAGRGAKGGPSPRPDGGSVGPVRGRATHLSLRLGSGRDGDDGARRSDAGGGGAEKTAGGVGSSLTVAAGTPVEVRGRLTDADGDAVAGRTVEVLTAAARGAVPRRTLRRVQTDRGGRFRLRLPAGSSRRVSASFAGGDGLAASRSRPLALRVGSAVTLEAEPHALATGEALLLRGRVSPGSARIPRRGKVVTIQYLEHASGDWRPALVVRTDRDGRFHVRYRFRYITGEARIRLRATVLPEAGWPYAEGSSAPVTVRVHG